MKFKHVPIIVLCATVVPAFAQYGVKDLKVGATISSNASGTQGDYHVEYWKDGGSGSMTLGEGGNFTCEWGQVNNILFRKGVRPGTRNEVIVYDADYKPQGNSYLSIYGWFENPLVEYYIIESWGSWKPPSDKKSKGTVVTDSGTYDIYENSRTGASIKGTTTFQQYWSVRREKKTSGTITCANHFGAWEKAGMKIGKFYEVSFNVEAYQSPGGKADVVVAIVNDSVDIATGVHPGRSASVMVPLHGYTPELYNVLGQKVAGFPGKGNFSGSTTILFNRLNRASGVYFFSAKVGER